VFSDAFIGEDEAVAALMGRLDGPPQAPPRIIKFVAGRRRKGWIKNCVALGLASGFLEPLESTSIHLIQAAISRILSSFPDRSFDPLLIDRFNRDMDLLYESVRDFLIAHYKTTEREDTPFWRHCRAIQLPDSLETKLELFRRRGEVMVDNYEPFREVNWFAILYGQGLIPEDYHPIADVMPANELALRLNQIKAGIDMRVQGLPSHQRFLEACCATPGSSR
jgi:tryptophan halogenase